MADACRLSPRLQALRDRLFAEPRELSLERAALYTESWRETEGMPAVLRRAQALAHVLDRVEIRIAPHELLVGDRTLRPRSGIASPEMSIDWLEAELDTMATRPQDPFVVRESDKVVFRETLAPFWRGRTLGDRIRARLPAEIMEPVRAKLVKLNQTDKGQGHIIPRFDEVLDKGLVGVLASVRERMADEPGNPFLEAAKLGLEACSRFVDRYACLAAAEAGRADGERRRELERIAEVCAWVATAPPRTFHEALQLFWFVNLALQFESNASSISPGRFDQYMLPFYRRDRAAGGLAEDEARELLRCLWIKFNDVVLLRSAESARYFGGFPTGYTVVLGGVTPDGGDAVNELSCLCLDTYADIRLPQPNLAVRVHRGISPGFLRRTAEVIRLGTGLPQLFNDEAIVPGFVRRGIPLQDARDYAVVGCVELSIPGRTYGLHDIAMMNLAKVLEVTCVDPLPPTFPELLERFERRTTELVAQMAEGANIVDRAHADLAPTPLLSCFVADCVEQGRDVSAGGARFNFSGVQAVGVANVADALCAIRRLTYEERQLEATELIRWLLNDFEGGETVRQRLVNECPKYGNDVDEVDLLAREVLRHYCLEVEKQSNPRGGGFHPGAYTVSAHIPMGAVVGATADGRRHGEQLADGGLSPMTGRDRRGPTAVLRSVAKLDNRLTINGSLLNLRFHPSAVAGDGGLERFTNLLRVFCDLGLQHVQFNIVSAETLRQAQREPARFGNLVVRVAGYSALFTELDRAIQEDIINRTEHML
jgi:formate C-acetyltransferase